jgi:ATP-dependent DNA helicase PIF1
LTTDGVIILTDFVDMLNAMRFGQLNSRTIEEFNKLSRPLVYNDGIEPTEL